MEMRADSSWDLVRRDPLLAAVEMSEEVESVSVKIVCDRIKAWTGGENTRWADGVVLWLTDGEVRVGVDFGNGVGPEWAIGGAGRGSNGSCSMRVVGIDGLLEEGPLE
jgi:hypothetical protein